MESPCTRRAKSASSGPSTTTSGNSGSYTGSPAAMEPRTGIRCLCRSLIGIRPGGNVGLLFPVMLDKGTLNVSARASIVSISGSRRAVSYIAIVDDDTPRAFARSRCVILRLIRIVLMFSAISLSPIIFTFLFDFIVSRSVIASKKNITNCEKTA